jgi:hypothetical protein
VGLLSRALWYLATKVAGKLAEPQAGPLSPAMLQDDEDPRELPPGTPLVSFSPRALEMLAEPARLASERKEPVQALPGPRPGSLAWRIAQLKRT